MKIRVFVTLKPSILDPQGTAIEHSLSRLGFEGVQNLRQGKVIEFDLNETDEHTAREKVTQMCKQLLANTVIENYTVDIL